MAFTDTSAHAIPSTWGGLFQQLASSSINAVQVWYALWIRSLVMNRVEMLAQMEGQLNDDSFTQTGHILYGSIRPEEAPAEAARKKAFKSSWASVPYSDNTKVKQQLNDMRQLQHNMQQQLRNRHTTAQF